MLGGTRYVGRTVVEAALARGDEVTTLNRGVSRAPAAGVEALTADRTNPAALRAAVGPREWDAVIDTWSGMPRTVLDSCSLLADRVAHCGYVSSWVVYRPPIAAGADERAPAIDGDPEGGGEFYPAAKRGGELAVLRAFGDRGLIARAGPTLGPYEDVGSMTWWLRRIHRGGQVLAPGNPTDRLQYIDVRDLAAWMLTAAARGLGGTYNTVSPHGQYTMGDLLETAQQVTGSDAELIWVPEKDLLEAGIRPYADIPFWLPASLRGGLNSVDSSAARRAGLDTSRTLHSTLTDAWAWLSAEGATWQQARRGLDPVLEQRVLAEHRRG